MTTRRKFLATAGVGAAAAGLASPAIAQNTIRWRMQTYAGAALAEMAVGTPVSRPLPGFMQRPARRWPPTALRRALLRPAYLYFGMRDL